MLRRDGKSGIHNYPGQTVRFTGEEMVHTPGGGHEESMSELELRERRERFRLAAAAGTLSATELYDFQLGLQWDVFGEPPEWDRSDIAADDPRVQAILDALEALAVVESDDAAHPRARAIVLAAVGRHAEAAKDYLLAAERFDSEYRKGDGMTGDENEWADVARYQAAKSLVLAGEFVAAQALMPQLSEDDRAEVERLLDV
jgi:hypothetical protein